VALVIALSPLLLIAGIIAILVLIIIGLDRFFRAYSDSPVNASKDSDKQIAPSVPAKRFAKVNTTGVSGKTIAIGAGIFIGIAVVITAVILVIYGVQWLFTTSDGHITLMGIGLVVTCVLIAIGGARDTRR
jgi:hypothetical protein